MIIGEYELRKMYPELDENQYQPNSIDLKLGKIYICSAGGLVKNMGLYNNKKYIPEKMEIEPDDNGIYELKPNLPYWIEIEPKITIPDGIAQFYLPRSSLLRIGITLHTALGDSGFNGHLMFLAINNYPAPVSLAKGERVATAINFEVDDAGLYNGDYNEY